MAIALHLASLGTGQANGHSFKCVGLAMFVHTGVSVSLELEVRLVLGQHTHYFPLPLPASEKASHWQEMVVPQQEVSLGVSCVTGAEYCSANLLGPSSGSSSPVPRLLVSSLGSQFHSPTFC